MDPEAEVNELAEVARAGKRERVGGPRAARHGNPRLVTQEDNPRPLAGPSPTFSAQVRNRIAA